MDLKQIEILTELVERKNILDKTISWEGGYLSYFKGLKEELLEVEQELESDRLCFLEDELADVLWDYMNLVKCLEVEKNISIDRIYKRCIKKYSERINAIENGGSWSETKLKQNQELMNEHLRSALVKD